MHFEEEKAAEYKKRKGLGFLEENDWALCARRSVDYVAVNGRGKRERKESEKKEK